VLAYNFLYIACATRLHSEDNSKKFWEEVIHYFPLIRHRSHKKRRLQQFFVAAGTSLPNFFLSNDMGIHSETHRHTLPTVLLLRVFFAAGTCLTSSCLETIGGIYIQTHRLMGWICEVRYCDGLRCRDIHIEFHKARFRHSNVNGGGGGIHRHTASMEIA
jgi:hypothetical protein